MMVLLADLLWVLEFVGHLLVRLPQVRVKKEVFVDNLGLQEHFQKVLLEETLGEVEGANWTNQCHLTQAGETLDYYRI